MVSHLDHLPHPERPLGFAPQGDVLRNMITAAMKLVNAEFAAFSTRLSDALMAMSEVSGDAKEANASFNASNLLRNNRYAFYHVAVAHIEQALLYELNVLEHGSERTATRREGALSLVPFSEMDNRVMLGTTARLFEIENADALAALNIRIAHLLDRDSISVAQNPFRPETFLGAINAAWVEFDPDTESHGMILPLLRPEVFLALPPVFKTLNDELVDRGVLPELVSAYRIRKSDGNLSAATKEANETALRQQLRRVLGNPEEAAHSQHGEYTMPANPASAKLFSFLTQLQHGLPEPRHPGLTQLAQIKAQMPQGSMSRIDETTIDLLSQIFETVFQDQHIPHEVKDLIGILQVPVLKAALVDKEFFYTESHPARKLIDLLTRSSVGWDKAKGVDDPLFQTLKRTVERVRQHDPEQAGNGISQAVDDLESYIHQEESAVSTALQAPITQALQVEKIRFATKSAKQDVAVRIGTGEVVPFVEAFLESRWVPVLTLAHTIKDEKPEVLNSAIQTMDDLLWSIKPKITPQHRKELITRLPTILTMLNKWLNVIKWDDADRLQFFADLAECHASIVRAPLELSAERQIEIAVEVAKKAAERRLEIKAREQAEVVAEPEPDQFVEEVDCLQRGAWLEFDQQDGASKKVKLAWVSPLRTLYIFSTSQRQEAFSLSSDDLARQLREQSARVLQLDGMVHRALAKAMEQLEPETAEQ
ncbi:hypothetical protein RCH09_000609 [Actimicrobium sp. GrIS 1.19]|uniref:DUF1631 family protein n=1 Tax=Actimicrobium sp. GrIS 1.19 TaxID=3071708 RepID=UPI002E02434E|nr:hypothetical protein [Actimicrobium sp. GrIS 1.19]